MQNTGHIEQWIESLRDVRARIETMAAASTAAERATRPDAKSWSFDQVVEHIISVNTSLMTTVRAVQAGTYKAGIMSHFPRVARILGSLILRSVQPQTQSKIKTVPGWEPRSSGPRDDMTAMFVRHQEELCTMIESVRNLPLHNIIISSPENSAIVYTLHTAVQIIVAHEQRHCNQAERTLAMVRSNA
ncbi:MAG: DinB family protein [Candidatus Kapaibacterium sp.]